MAERLHLPSTDVILTKQAHSLFKIFGRRTAPTSVRVIGLRFYVIARPKYLEPTLAKKVGRLSLHEPNLDGSIGRASLR